MARCLLQNLKLTSAILDFGARCSKIKSKLSILVDTWDGTLDHRREKALSSLYLRVIIIRYFTYISLSFLKLAVDVDSTRRSTRVP